MAPYKLEDNIREKLEARELKPSADAWKKLESKLDAAQPKKKTLVWYYVAASFVGFLILASVFFSRNDSKLNNQIVDENVELNNSKKDSEIIPNNSETEKIVSEENNPEKVEATIPKNETENPKQKSFQQKPIQQKKSAIDKKIEKMEAIANVLEEQNQQSLKTTVQETKQEDKIFNNKVDEVVASVKKLQENKTEVTANDVEALLNNARREIQTQRILNSTKVDATALLQDVEWDLDKSFRDKVFDALGEGFNKVRTAVTERNE